MGKLTTSILLCFVSNASGVRVMIVMITLMKVESKNVIIVAWIFVVTTRVVPLAICQDFHCSACADIDIVGAAKSCDDHESFCTSCIFGHNTSCVHCLGLHFPTIVARNKKQKEENDELKRKNKELRSKNGNLTKVNKELQNDIEDLRGSG